MFQWLESRAWQIGAIAGGVAAAGLAVALGVATVQRIGLERDVARLETRLTSSEANLRTCHGNATILEAAIDDRNREIQRVTQAGADKLRAAEDAVTLAKGETARLNARINLLASTPVLGPTPCEQVEEIDRAVLEAFK